MTRYSETYYNAIAALAALGGALQAARFAHEDQAFVRFPTATVVVKHALPAAGEVWVTVDRPKGSFTPVGQFPHYVKFPLPAAGLARLPALPLETP